MKSREGKAPVTVFIDEEQRIRMIQLGISPTTIARAAFAAEIKRREGRLALRGLQRIDPTVTEEQRLSGSVRIQRLRTMTEVLGESADQ